MLVIDIESELVLHLAHKESRQSAAKHVGKHVATEKFMRLSYSVGLSRILSCRKQYKSMKVHNFSTSLEAKKIYDIDVQKRRYRSAHLKS